MLNDDKNMLTSCSEHTLQNLHLLSLECVGKQKHTHIPDTLCFIEVQSIKHTPKSDRAPVEWGEFIYGAYLQYTKERLNLEKHAGVILYKNIRECVMNEVSLSKVTDNVAGLQWF